MASEPVDNAADDRADEPVEGSAQGEGGDNDGGSGGGGRTSTEATAPRAEVDGEGGDGVGDSSDGAGAFEPDLMSAPDDGDSFLTGLVEAEAAIRDPSLDPGSLRAWGRRQQALYRYLRFNPEWADRLATIEDPTIREAAELNWQARQSLSALLATEELHAELPAWRVVEPLPPDELIGYYKTAEARTGIPWEYVAGIHLVETRMGRIQGISTAGAVGPMQFLPTTWDECCEGDPTNPADAIVGAAVYLTVRGGPEDMSKALWGYNNSDHYVDAVSAYAEVIAADERAYYGFHGWEIFFLTTEGLVELPIGYEQQEETQASEWLVDNPDRLLRQP